MEKRNTQFIVLGVMCYVGLWLLAGKYHSISLVGSLLVGLVWFVEGLGFIIFVNASTSYVVPLPAIMEATRCMKQVSGYKYPTSGTRTVVIFLITSSYIYHG